MRLVTSSFVGCIHRSFAVARERRAGLSLISAWTQAGAPLHSQELWPRFAAAAGPDATLDAGIPKSASEVLLAGHAHPSEPTTHQSVGVELRGRRKTVHVVGDRVWRNGVPTEPAPFERMPLSWDRAFGGEGFARNPLGRGFVGRGDPEGVPLPNLERPGAMIRSPRDTPEPAGFGPFGPDWPQRMEGLGTYDQRWLEEDFPGFARDIDWRVHNVAPEDQRFEEPFAPGERVVLHHLVEGRPRVEIELPRVQARCFTYADEANLQLQEVSLSLRTLWLLPDQDLFVLVFHGSQRSSSMLGSDVAGVLLALDWADRPRDLAHYQRALERRLDRELGAAEMLDDRPLMPEGMDFPGFEARGEDLTMPSRAGALEANLRAGAEQRRQEALEAFREAGFDNGEELFPPLPPPEPPSKEPLAEQIRKAVAEAEEKRKEAEAQAEAQKAQAREELEALGEDPSFLDAPPKGGPPPILAAQRLEMLQQVVREARAAGQPLEPFERQLDDPDFHRELFEQEAMGREAYRMSAHLVEGPPEVSPERARALRVEVETALREGYSLAQADLTGAELAELDLSGVDLRGAWLEGANLQDANLTRARLDRAVLAKADLADAVLRGTSLAKANLGRARLLWTHIDGCDLGEAILAHADLRGVTVSRSNLRGADLGSVRVERTAFADSDLSESNFLQMSLAGVRFERCKLEDCNFIEVDLTETVFGECRLGKASFVDCEAPRVVLYGSQAPNLRFVAGCVLDEADFRRVVMPKSTLRGSALRRACFDEADLRGSDLSSARCEEARFYRANLRDALATECELRGATLAGANLMNAILQAADLRSADLRGTNLFAADLALVHGDDRTSFDGALMKRARHRPLRKEPA